jgi:hypothetical protein
MSMSIHVELDEDISVEKAFEILSGSVKWITKTLEGPRTVGTIEGASVAITRSRPRGQELCDELYGIRPILSVGFRPNKFVPYEVSHSSAFDSVVALIKATRGDAVVTEGDSAFLRRIDGRVTLFNEGGLFDADVLPQWRPKFDFPHEFKERFER